MEDATIARAQEVRDERGRGGRLGTCHEVEEEKKQDIFLGRDRFFSSHTMYRRFSYLLHRKKTIQMKDKIEDQNLDFRPQMLR